MKDSIPFNKPGLVGKEHEYVSQVLASGALASDGPFTRNCARLLEKRYGIHRVLMTASGSAALDMAAQLCDLKPGDEVILPSFTAAATANAVVRQGARPIFVDIRPDTLNLDDRLVEEAITPRTRAVFPVHYAGVPCKMDRIVTIARKYNLRVVEDAAQAVHAFFEGKALGSLGDLGAFSFDDGKNYTGGAAGALCVNAPELLARAEILRNHGMQSPRHRRAALDRPAWVEVGCAAAPAELACAFLYAQLEQLDDITEQRCKSYDFYRRRLKPLEAEGWLTLPAALEDDETNYHIFYILLADARTREALRQHLLQKGIHTATHYTPLHTSPLGQKLGCIDGALSVTEDVCNRLLRLPLYHAIKRREQMEVINGIRTFLERRAAECSSVGLMT